MKQKGLLFGLAVLVLGLAACGPSGATPGPDGEITIIQIDEEGGMRFEPGDIVLTAGQKVRIILENQGEKDHEFMVGRNVIYEDTGAPNGFEVDFFEGIEDQVTVVVGEGSMLMIDGEVVQMGGEMGMGSEMEGGMEEDEHAEGEEHADEHGGEGDMDHMGWMVMDSAGSERTIIEFTVPESRVGEWEMGCFEDDGTHYEDGMRGTLTVVEP